MDIQSPAAYAPRSADSVGSIIPAVPLPASPTVASDATSGQTLGPAATVDLSDEAREAAGRTPSDAPPGTDGTERRFSVDPDTRQIVFQVFDPASNTVLDQLPNESALRARAYAREASAQGTANQSLDRTA